MARVKGPDGGPRWPELIEWLLQNQRPDGSWGGEIEYYHDRIICTLIAILALHENGRSKESRSIIRHGETYIWQHLHLLPRDPYELVGFELIIPTLLGEAQQAGLNVPNHTCGYEKIQTTKLKLIPAEMLYSPQISTVHSLEFLGKSANHQKIQSALNSLGALGNSPATTAYYLMLDEHQNKAWKYLDSVRNHASEIIYLYPFRIFELTWVLNNLSYSRIPISNFAQGEIWEELKTDLASDGIGLDPAFGIPDGDITSVCTRLLIESGHTTDPAILKQFEDENGVFRTYQFERNISVGTNVHALQAIETMDNYPNQEKIKENLILMLLDARKYHIYWIDKWHASPFYITSHVLISLSKEGRHLGHICNNTVDWLLHNQRPNGSWGFFQRGTAEETAYVMMALLHYHRYKPLDERILHQGAAYLRQIHINRDSKYPELWIGKCLYTPQNIVDSAILSSLILYHTVFPE
jgi:halimadienyl-diphosphate synthase